MKFIKKDSNFTKEEILKLSRDNLLEWKEKAGGDPDFYQSLNDEGIVLNFGYIIGFGTAGLRGKMLPGPANMNKETVALATFSLAQLVLEAGGKDAGVVIACDSRNNSDEFSRLAASVLAATGVKAYIFDSLRPTPELSFAIRYLGCKAGINITASHNTKEYNGYKVYWEDGAQLPPIEAKKVADRFYETDIWNIPVIDFGKGVSEGKIEVVGKNVDDEYVKNVLAQIKNENLIKENSDKLNVLYTPLHGAGYRLVPTVLEKAGFKNVKTVATQLQPDGDFPTVERPNPQFIQAFNEGIKVAGDADVIIATDPDADRMGVALKNSNGEFEALTGNQIALVIIDYIIKSKNLPTNPAMVKSIVSSVLAEVMCKKNGIKVFDVYTGFKYIGEKIKEFEEKGDYNFIFGFEESYGYLTGTYARDKDGVSASLTLAEAALYAKLQGKTLLDIIDDIYKEYGFWGEYWGETIITVPNFAEEMSSIMKKLRCDPPHDIAGLTVVKITDYEKSIAKDLVTGKEDPIPFAPDNVLSYTLSDGSSVTIRPSGTEPKIKLYYFISSNTKEESLEKLEKLKSFFNF